MRNRALHDALKEFALDAAALLCEDQRAGAELEFDVEDEGRGRGPALYRYRPRSARFVAERWERLRAMPSCARAADALGSGAAAWLRAGGTHAVDGRGVEPALGAMLERLYEDATSFSFPEERFERVFRDVEATLYRDSVRSTVLVPLRGLELSSERVELGDGLALVRGDAVEAPRQAAFDENGAATLCMLECDAPPDDDGPLAEADARFRSLLTALRLFAPGGVALAALGWRSAGEGRWLPVELEPSGVARGEPLLLEADEAPALRDLLDALERFPPAGTVSWALERFEMGCGRPTEAQALSDLLLGLRALLDATDEAGRAALGLRLAALCAEEGERRATQRRLERALELERQLMAGGGTARERWGGSDSPRALVAELERHLRALLRDVVGGYLDCDLKGVADDILLETTAAAEPFAIEARDLRLGRRTAPPPPEPAIAGFGPRGRGAAGAWPDDEPVTTDFEAPAEAVSGRRTPVTTDFERAVSGRRTAAAPPEAPAASSAPERAAVAAPDGVTPSADWVDDDPDSYSAPV